MKPMIAVAGRVGPRGRVSRDAVVFAGRRCVDAVLRAGGEPLLLSPQPLTVVSAESLLARFDGLLLMGGADVEPQRYGQQPHASVYGVDSEHDEFEVTLAIAARTMELPTLALCRGMQVCNVAAGGTLFQHLQDLPGLIDHGPPTGAASTVDGVLHSIHVVADSKLAEAVGAHEKVVGNSYHHQAVDRVGDGFRVTARTDDGTVEAIEYETGWCVGVQWHPEDTAHVDPVQQRLFDALVRRACDAKRRDG